MTGTEWQEVVSLMLRDCTIVAKRHHDLARDYRAMASTWRRLLDANPANLLPSPVREKDVAAFGQPSLDFGSGSEKDFDA